MRRFIVVISAALLLTICGIMWFHQDRNQQQQINAVNQNQVEYINLQNQNENTDLNNRLLKVNSIEMGEKIKYTLDTHPEVIVINHNNQDKSHYHDHEVTVKFKTPQTKAEIRQYSQDINGKLLKELNTIYIFRSNDKRTSELMQYFNKKQNVIYTEPNFLLLQNEKNRPNDLLYQEKYQWNLPVIETEAGWDISRGNKNVTIAIVDTGVDLDHPDLKKRLVKGYNVIENNHSPDDDNGHGTHVAGIIASETNNREGIAGVTWYNRIMPVKALGAEGYGTTFDIAKGIVWAADHGADVINMSLGNYQPSAVLQEAIQYAYEKGATLVAAAGNDNTTQPSFPAALPEVLSVSAVDYHGNRAEFSNYGDYIDIAAPGVQIPSTYFHKQYAALSGTSMAAPHVAGLAGLILSTNQNLTNDDVVKIIKRSAIDIGQRGNDEEFGSGLIDIKTALQTANRTKDEQPKRSIFNRR